MNFCTLKVGRAGPCGGKKFLETPSALIAAIGSIKSPTFREGWTAPQSPRNKTAFGLSLGKYLTNKAHWRTYTKFNNSDVSFF